MLNDLAHEGAALDALVAPLDDAGWRTSTPAVGWDIATQVAHLAWTDEVAVFAATDKVAWDEVVLQAIADPEGFAGTAALAGAQASPAEILARWREARPALQDTLRAYPAGERIPWFGPPMSPTSMATARFMETWAHSLDVAEALGVVSGADRPDPARRAPRCPHAQLLLRRCTGWSRLPRTSGSSCVLRPARCGSGVRSRRSSRCAGRRTTSACGSPSVATVTTSTWSQPVPMPTSGSTSPRPSLAPRDLAVPRRLSPSKPGTHVSQALRVGNCSGFYGDRLSAMRELLEGGDLDIVTGDYLAELTMLILGKDQLKDPSLGYARTFVTQVSDCLALALEKGVRIVANAGGLNPAGLVDKLGEVAEEQGLSPKIAWVDGDNLAPRASELGLDGALTANAYLGAFGIARALEAGADIVVTGRVTDASVVVGPAVWRFGWSPEQYDELAGAVVAGHVIECGTQATGGNFSGFLDLPRDAEPLGFPIAEIAADGSSVITKHDGTGGLVSVDTVTAQLMYEVQSGLYLGPDVTVDLTTIQLADERRGPGAASPAYAALPRHRS